MKVIVIKHYYCCIITVIRAKAMQWMTAGHLETVRHELEAVVPLNDSVTLTLRYYITL